MEPTERNQRAWAELRRRRAEATAEEQRLPRWVRSRLPVIVGKHVLHLHCWTGEATEDLAELGALVTGVDDSAEALEAARERLPNAVFIAADVHELPLEMRRGRFDLVLADGPVLDLASWAAGAVAALKPGGQLFLRDAHPVVGCLDAALRWRRSYFDEDALRLGEIVTAVAEAGLVVVRLDEAPAQDRRVQDPRVPAELLLVARKPS